jgi:hypothetical protein
MSAAKRLLALITTLLLTYAAASALHAEAFPFIGANLPVSPQVLGASTGLALYPSATLVNVSGTIYFVRDASKIPFSNYQAFTGLGYSLKNVISGDLSNYSSVPAYIINSANIAHPWGSWLLSNGTIYYVTQQGLIGVANPEVFTSNSGQWNLVVNANKYDLDILAANPQLPILTDADPRVYNHFLAKSIKIISPNGGEQMMQGSTQTITWSAPASVTSVNISISDAACFNHNVPCDPILPTIIIASGIANSGSYNWTITTNIDLGKYFLTIADASSSGLSASSAASFTITAASSAKNISFLSPKGAEQWPIASTQTISWSAPASVSKVNIYMLSANCLPGSCAIPLITVAQNVPNTGSYSWNISSSFSQGNYTLYINDANSVAVGLSGAAASNVFSLIKSVVVNPISVVSPGGGEQWMQGSNQTIKWTAPASVTNVNISLTAVCQSTCNTYTIVNTIASNVPNTGSYIWNITQALAVGQYNIFIADAGNSGLSASSAAPFNITAALVQNIGIISPGGGEQWTIGSSQSVRWTAPSSIANVNITLNVFCATNLACIQSIIPIASSIPNNGSYSWTIASNIAAGQYIIKIADAGGSTLSATSNAFALKAVVVNNPPVVSSLNPTSGPVGTSVTISGSGFTATGNSVNFGGSSTVIANLVSANGSTIVFTVPANTNPVCSSQCLAPLTTITPGNYAVTVSNANGTSSTSQNFTVTPTISADKITADQVFDTSMIGQTWHFKDGFNDDMWIAIEAAPQPVIAGYGGTNVVWHYTKSGCNGYWAIGTCNAELRFVLHKVDQTDINNGMTAEIGSWLSTASLISFPTAPWWATPGQPLYSTFDLAQNPTGTHQGYLIIPLQATPNSLSVATHYFGYSKTGTDASVLTFDSVISGTPPNATEWRTDTYTRTVNIPGVYSGPTMVSDQHEACDPVSLDGMFCAAENWDFAPGLGLVRINITNDGHNQPLDPRLTMLRQPN